MHTKLIQSLAACAVTFGAATAQTLRVIEIDETKGQLKTQRAQAEAPADVARPEPLRVGRALAAPQAAVQALGDDRGFLGVYLGDGEEGGAAVAQLVDDSPAESSGMKAGDVIVSINGEKVANAAALTAAVQKLKAGTVVKVVIQRDGGKITKEVTLGSRPGATPGATEDETVRARVVDPRDNGLRENEVEEVELKDVTERLEWLARPKGGDDHKDGDKKKVVEKQSEHGEHGEHGAHEIGVDASALPSRGFFFDDGASGEAHVIKLRSRSHDDADEADDDDDDDGHHGDDDHDGEFEGHARNQFQVRVNVNGQDLDLHGIKPGELHGQIMRMLPHGASGQIQLELGDVLEDVTFGPSGSGANSRVQTWVQRSSDGEPRRLESGLMRRVEALQGQVESLQKQVRDLERTVASLTEGRTPAAEGRARQLRTNAANPMATDRPGPAGPSVQLRAAEVRPNPPQRNDATDELRNEMRDLMRAIERLERRTNEQGQFNEMREQRGREQAETIREGRAGGQGRQGRPGGQGGQGGQGQGGQAPGVQ